MIADAVTQALQPESLAAVREQLETLSARVAALETMLTTQTRSQSTGAAALSSNGAPNVAGEVPAEIIAVISAVLAAHLGVRPRIRQISLLTGAAWAQQGRVTIQASHALAIQRD